MGSDKITLLYLATFRTSFWAWERFLLARSHLIDSGIVLKRVFRVIRVNITNGIDSPIVNYENNRRNWYDQLCWNPIFGVPSYWRYQSFTDRIEVIKYHTGYLTFFFANHFNPWKRVDSVNVTDWKVINRPTIHYSWLIRSLLLSIFQKTWASSSLFGLGS